MIDSKYIQTILESPVYERLKNWYEIGPVQRATLDEFVEELVWECIVVAKMYYNPDEPYGNVEDVLKEHWKIKSNDK